jgi:hypothetical protein
LALPIAIVSSCNSKVEKLRKSMKMEGGKIIIAKKKMIQRGWGLISGIK